MRNYGLIEGLQELSAYILGSSVIPYIYYNESGNWESSLPKFEKQRTKNDFETNCCTVYATQNQIETFTKFVYGYEPNYSDKFTAILCGLDGSNGQDPQVAHENVRKNGLIEESELRTGTTLEDFFDKDDITGSLLAKGQRWLTRYEYTHEWVWDKRPENYIEVLRDALKTSPIAVSVSAWNEVNGVYVSNQGSVNNHYCLLYKIDDEGYPWIFDTYDYSKKKLAKDHNIRRAKRIWLGDNKRKSMRRHISLLQLILNKLMQKETFLDICTNALGTDVTPQDNVPDEVACAEVVTTLLKKKYPETPIIPGTWKLLDYLSKPTSNFTEIHEYEAGSIVVAATGTGKAGTIGHTWVVMEDGTLASNNSFGIYRGRFTKNYTPETVERKYRDEYKMPIRIFKRIV